MTAKYSWHAAVLQLRSTTCYTRRRVYVYSLGQPTWYSSEQVLRKDPADGASLDIGPRSAPDGSISATSDQPASRRRGSIVTA